MVTVKAIRIGGESVGKCHKCGGKATYFTIIRGKDGCAQQVETCGYHRQVELLGQ